MGHPTSVYDLLARLDPAGRFHLYRVTQVELVASVITAIHQPPQRVTIRLTRPNACSLPYDDLDLNLRAMLHASGIEPSAGRGGGAGGITPREALLDLVARVGAREGAAVRVSETDVRQ